MTKSQVIEAAIVLFTDRNIGFVVSECTSNYTIGARSTDWHDCYDDEEWARLPVGSTVTLEQA